MKRLVQSTLIVLTVLFTSCVDRRTAHVPLNGGLWSGPPESAEGRDIPRRSDANVVLVTLDGVRWQEIFRGLDPMLSVNAAATAEQLTPNLHRLFFDDGVVLGDPGRGSGIFASGPHFVSLPSYFELMTGAATECGGNDCHPDISWTIAEEVAYRTGARGDGVAVFSSWERVARTIGDSNLLLRAGRSNGDDTSPYPGSGGYRPDHGTAALGIGHLVRHMPRFLWIALGDTDEWAHKNDYRGYAEALRFADSFVGDLAAHLATMGEYGAHTTLIVTTDHGRDENFADHGGPASANVWLMARGGPIGKGGIATPMKRRYLRDVAPTISALFGHPVGSCKACGEVLEELL